MAWAFLVLKPRGQNLCSWILIDVAPCCVPVSRQLLGQFYTLDQDFSGTLEVSELVKAAKEVGWCAIRIRTILARAHAPRGAKSTKPIEPICKACAGMKRRGPAPSVLVKLHPLSLLQAIPDLSEHEINRMFEALDVARTGIYLFTQWNLNVSDTTCLLFTITGRPGFIRARDQPHV